MANPMEFPIVLPGIISELTATVLDDNGIAPQTVIKRTDPWKVEVKLHLEGGATRFIAGKFKVRAHLDSIGRGFEDQVGTEEEMVLNGVDPQDLAATIAIPASIALPAPQPEAGAYKLTTVVTYVRNGGTPDEIAGFVEGPVVQLYDPI